MVRHSLHGSAFPELDFSLLKSFLHDLFAGKKSHIVDDSIAWEDGEEKPESPPDPTGTDLAQPAEVQFPE